MGSALGVVTLLSALAGCGGSATRPPPATTGSTSVAATVPASTTVAATTTTTVYRPTGPQASPDAAAARLVSAWAGGDRAAAASVATPTAVQALFATPYPAGYLQSRGCTAGANPATCTYRNTQTNGIYEIQAAEVGAGPQPSPAGSGGQQQNWYVTSVTLES
jgi:hypothetical protein